MGAVQHIVKHVVRVVHSHIRELKKKATRSPEWRKVEKTFLATHSSCAACDGKKRLQVHHVRPFHLHPELELELTNLITLCMGPYECHLRIGHGDDWKAYNANVRIDAARCRVAPSERETVEARAKAQRKYGA